MGYESMPSAFFHKVEILKDVFFWQKIDMSIYWTHSFCFYFQKLYEEMKSRIETAYDLGRVPAEERSKHKEFSDWDSYVSRRDHDTILQVWLSVHKISLLPSMVALLST